MAKGDVSIEDRMAAPARAAAVRSELELVFERRRDKLLKGLIADYRSGRLDYDKMVGAIAELSGMQQIIDEITREISQADEE